MKEQKLKLCSMSVDKLIKHRDKLRKKRDNRSPGSTKALRICREIINTTLNIERKKNESYPGLFDIK